MSPSRLAWYLSVSEKTVYRLRVAGEIPAIRVGDRCWRYNPDAVVEALQVRGLGR